MSDEVSGTQQAWPTARAGFRVGHLGVSLLGLARAPC
jgi:hypothetical protein